MNQFGGSRTDTLIKLVLLFFTSLLSFSVGTFVGKQFSDKQHQLTAIESEFEVGNTARDTASVINEAGSQKTENAEDVLTEEDIAALADELAKSETKTAAVEPKADIKRAADKTRSVIEKATNRVANGEEPMDAKAKTAPRVPASFPSVVSSSTIGKYTVQIASYQSEGEARSYAETLKNQGFSAFYIPAVIKGNTWYRVSVGVFADRNSAKEYRKTILQQANLKSAIVQKIIK